MTSDTAFALHPDTAQQQLNGAVTDDHAVAPREPHSPVPPGVPLRTSRSFDLDESKAAGVDPNAQHAGGPMTGNRGDAGAVRQAPASTRPVRVEDG